MARDTVAWSTPAPTPGAAVSGLINTAQSFVHAANIAGNFERAAAFANLIVAASHLRRVLVDIDPQIDAAVQTQVTALIALL